MVLLNVMSTAPFGRIHDLRWLATKALGKVLMASLHLLMRHVDLGLSGLVRRDLRRRGTLSTRCGQVVFNLLTPWAGRVEILARVPADLGLPAATALDFVAQRRQSHRQLRSVHRRRVLLRAIELPRNRVPRGRGSPQKAAVVMSDHGGVSEVPPAGPPMSRPSTLRPRQDGRDGERLCDVDLF